METIEQLKLQVAERRARLEEEMRRAEREKAIQAQLAENKPIHEYEHAASLAFVLALSN